MRVAELVESYLIEMKNTKDSNLELTKEVEALKTKQRELIKERQETKGKLTA